MGTNLKCLVCYYHNSKETATIQGAIYNRCDKCGSISTNDYITPLILTHNDTSEARNTKKNNMIRIKRIETALGYTPITVLDYGCGEGQLVKTCKDQGIDAIGTDMDFFAVLSLIRKGSIDAITMIEVIEHLYNHAIFIVLSDLLKPNGIIMIETTFADNIKDMSNHSYIEPRIGHVCILSLKGLKTVLPANLIMEKPMNSNVVILRKTTE